MKALVTGANGFLGRAVVRALRARGHDVRAMVRPAARTDGLWDDQVEVVRADLRAPPPLAEALADVGVLVHLAASVLGDEDEQFAATVVGTERLLGALPGSPVRRVVLASSFAVYDWHSARGELTEATPVERDAPARGGYTVAKVWQERVTRRMCAEAGLELAVLRPGFLWGPGGGEWVAGQGQRVGPAELVPIVLLPLTYVDNCAEAFALAAEHPAAAGTTLNVTDDEGVPALRFARESWRRGGPAGRPVPLPYGAGLALARLAEAVSRLLFGPTGRLPSILVPVRYEARFKPLRFPNRALRETLGWAPHVGFEQALDRTFGPARELSPHAAR